ncbi:MAG: DUF1365 domain-containing protein [Pirellulaceae bacterium]|nr:DUF1365 domain-containing protein [Pirellulaceae bacterium]
MHSCLYEGYVRHRRFAPRPHEFRYRLFLMYLDLAELDLVFRRRLFWSSGRPAAAWFRRRDHFGDPREPLDETVRDFVAGQGRERPTGPIRLLTHLRYLGFVFNPVSFFFCHDDAGQLTQIVAEVNNTPWGERHCYLLDRDQFAGAPARPVAKEFHVSPFLPMDLSYRWRISDPAESLSLAVATRRQDERVFDANLRLRRREITTANLARALARHPLMTVQVVAAIYWQALRLLWKRTPVFPHPKTIAAHSAPQPTKP